LGVGIPAIKNGALMVTMGETHGPFQEYFTPNQRAIARAVAFLTTIVLVVKFGDSMDMPENPKYA